MYFAVLAMAGEVSTGILAMGYLYNRNPSVSMLLVKTEGEFFKKAIGNIVFTCNDGEAINHAIDQAIAEGKGTSYACTSTGVNESGKVVATFIFTWSFKARKSK